MTERQIRATIAAVLAELDLSARRVARFIVLPGLVGSGLAGCDHRSVSVEEASVPSPDAGSPRVDGIPLDRALPPWREISVVPPYMAPDPDLFPAPPPVTAYGVPPPMMDAGIGLMYGAPFPKKD